jgi:hypothetical protein
MNKKYQVAIREVYKVIVDVEASSEEEAKVKAEELLQSGDLPEGTYDYTLPDDEWQVWENWS